MRLIRKIHRYFALVLGLALLAWIASGIAMLFPAPTPYAQTKPTPRQADFSTVTMSPAEAALRWRELHDGGEGKIRRMVLRPLGDRLVFEVHARGAKPVLLDARTAERIEITAEMATALAGERLKDNLGQPTVERLEKHSVTYPWGPLPVYRHSFEDGRGTIAYVAVKDGAVQVTDRSKQLYRAIVSLHTFDPLKIILGATFKERTLLAAAFLSLVIVATGYYMEVLLHTRKRRKAKPD